uniref:Palmitoyltransferase n=1 Tax=Panagrolaimus sp. JU765 TaxID=591449 RepID=A0AC34R0W7_9BILA
MNLNWLPCWIDLEAQKPTLVLHPAIYNCPLYCGRKIIGKVLLPIVFGAILFEFFVTTAILLPYESYFSSTWVTWLYSFLIGYFVVNTLYHYFKARTLHPGAPVRSKLEPICRRCHTHKPRNASHCSICDTCIVDMDHHCIWLNNCVGAGNVRHFFLFIAFIAVGAMIWLPVAWR